MESRVSPLLRPYLSLLILLPCAVAPEREELVDMVREINYSEVDAADRLSDNVYRYS